MPNRIYRGPVAAGIEPRTVNLPLAGAYLLGVFVTSACAELSVVAAATSNMLQFSIREFYSQDITTAYASGDTGVAYRLMPGMEVYARFDADDYDFGDPLTVSSNGRLALATSDDVVVAYFDQADATLGNGAFADIVIANSYTVA